MKQEAQTAHEERTPARVLTEEDLAKVTGSGLLLGCCTQGCCIDPFLDVEAN